MNLNLKGEVAHVRNRMDEVSANLNSVKSDLQKQEEKWREFSIDLSARMSTIEKKSKSLENKLELNRESVAKDYTVLQSSKEGFGAGGIL